MTLGEIGIGIGFVTGACLVGLAYTFTGRGSTLGQDIQSANKRSRWFLNGQFLAQHWPLIVLITLYTLGFGMIAATAP